MAKKVTGRVTIFVPFSGYDEWDGEIERSIEREIVRLEGEEEPDKKLLRVLGRGDVD